MIFETFLTSTSSYGDVLEKVKGYLGEDFIESEWSEATTALFSGDEDNELSLANFRNVKAKYLTDPTFTVSLLILLYIISLITIIRLCLQRTIKM
jgi:hypothetical protein